MQLNFEKKRFKKKAFIIHPPFVFSILFSIIFTFILFYYIPQKENLALYNNINKILLYAINYSFDPICRIIFIVFVVLLFYLMIQFTGLYREGKTLSELIQQIELLSDEQFPENNKSKQYFHLKCIDVLTGRNNNDLYVYFTNTIGNNKKKYFTHNETVQLTEQFLSIYRSRLAEDLYLLNFGVWLLPILGFIGTVLGISEAIAGLKNVINDADKGQVFMDNLQMGMGTVLDGLSTAFDTTFLGLFFAIWIMFSISIIHRIIYAQVIGAFPRIIHHFSSKP